MFRLNSEYYESTKDTRGTLNTILGIVSVIWRLIPTNVSTRCELAKYYGKIIYKF